MGFFQIVLDHWIISLLAVLYVAVYFKTARRFYREADYNVGFRILFAIYALLGAPYFHHQLRKRDDAEADRKYQKEREEKRRQNEEFWRANAERQRLRKEWIASNPLTLFYNTVSGITVVMTPTMYKANQIATKWHRRNALWDKNVLMPDTAAFLFVDANGLELVFRNSGIAVHEHDHPIKNGWVSGWLTSLDDLVECYGITLEQKPEIFVPFVNQSVLPFKEHQFRRSYVDWYEYELVVKQTPEELQPLK